MRICFDPQIFSLQVYGGVSRYFLETAARLAELPDTSVSVLAFAHVNGYLAGGPRPGVIGWRLPAFPEPARRMLARVNQLLARAWLSRNGADIVHETYYSFIRTATTGLPTVLTVFDMIHEKFPDYAPRTKRIAGMKRAAIDRADHLLCISENTRRDLLDIYAIEPSRTSVVRPGFSLQPRGAAEAPRSVADPYILYVGKRGGYKDFDTLLRAYAGSAALSRNFLLVCFGDSRLSAGELGLMSRLGIARHRVLHVTGDDRQLAGCYRHAALFVYPSRYEGFGMPPLEAMSLDCPVVCSNAASLPEVVGEAALMFDAGDAEALRVAMESVLDSPALAAQLRQKGRQRVTEFSWDACARQTRAIYASVLQQR